MKEPYIYLISDKIKNKPYYVGKHNGNDKNYITGSKILRRYISIYGLENFFNRFDRSIIEYTNNELLNDKEEYYIKLYNTKKNGGNLTRGGRYDYFDRKVEIKPILQYDLYGNFIQEWRYGKEIWRSGLVKSYPDISACCLGKQPTSGGFIWRYKIDDNFPTKIKPYKRKKYKNRLGGGKSKSIIVEDIEYISMRQAYKSLNIGEQKFYRLIRENLINYKWIIE